MVIESSFNVIHRDIEFKIFHESFDEIIEFRQSGQKRHFDILDLVAIIGIGYNIPLDLFIIHFDTISIVKIKPINPTEITIKNMSNIAAIHTGIRRYFQSQNEYIPTNFIAISINQIGITMIARPNAKRYTAYSVVFVIIARSVIKVNYCLNTIISGIVLNDSGGLK